MARGRSPSAPRRVKRHSAATTEKWRLQANALGAIPILVGGSSGAALKRAARIGDGWHPLNLVGSSLSDGIAGYRAACGDYGRPVGRVLARLFPPVLEPGPERRVLMGDDPVAARELLAAFNAAGADELVLSWHDADVDVGTVLDRWERFANALDQAA